MMVASSEPKWTIPVYFAAVILINWKFGRRTLSLERRRAMFRARRIAVVASTGLCLLLCLVGDLVEGGTIRMTVVKMIAVIIVCYLWATVLTQMYFFFRHGIKQSAVDQSALVLRQATSTDAGQVTAVLSEAAQWLVETGRLMWRADELQPSRIEADVRTGMFWLAECDHAVAGVMKLQFEDELFWPDQPKGEAAYVHRLAVRRRFAGGKVSTALLQWAVTKARALGCRYVRLDCEASRAKLRAVYERFGFVHHSDRQVGPYFVARYEYRIVEPAGAGTSVESP